jgi:hypothetical protein
MSPGIARHHPVFAQVPCEALVAVLVLGMAKSDLVQRVTEDNLIVASSEQSGWDVDEQ